MRQNPNDTTNVHLKRFAEIVQQHRDELLRQWRDSVRLLPAARNLDTPTLNDHIPHLFDELTLALKEGAPSPFWTSSYMTVPRSTAACACGQVSTLSKSLPSTTFFVNFCQSSLRKNMLISRGIRIES